MCCVICNGNLSNGEATAVYHKGAESLNEAGGGEINFEARVFMSNVVVTFVETLAGGVEA